MKNSSAPQSATSLPRAPRDDAHSRETKYFLMMSVRVICFILMVAVTPYGWYTWLFAVGAVVLPYVAVVIANVSSNVSAGTAVSPERQLAAPTPSPQPAADRSVIRIHETGREPGTSVASDRAGSADADHGSDAADDTGDTGDAQTPDGSRDPKPRAS